MPISVPVENHRAKIWNAVSRMTAAQNRLPDLVAAPDAGPVDLSTGQQRLWFLNNMQADYVDSHVYVATEIDGDLNVPALRQAFAEVVRRHQPLRTTFELGPDGPVGVVSRDARGVFRQVDLRGSFPDPPALRDRLSALCRQELRRPFDLACGPLIRATLLRGSDRGYVWLVVAHSIIFDDRSRDILCGELRDLYGAFAAGRASPLADLEIQYGDFTRWRGSCLNEPTVREQLQAWRSKWTTRYPLLDLAGARPAGSQSRACRYSTVLGRDVAAGLKQFCKERGITVNLAVLSALCALLRKYTGQEDILVFSSVSGRRRPELNELIGFFPNFLLLRVEVAEDLSFDDLVSRVVDVTLEAQLHQDLPFEEIIGGIDFVSPRAPARNYEVFYVHQTHEPIRPELTGAATSAWPVDGVRADFDLGISTRESKAGLETTVEYDAEIFDEAWVEQWLTDLAAVLNSMLSDPQRGCGEVTIGSERRRPAASWPAAGDGPTAATRCACAGTINGASTQLQRKLAEICACLIGSEQASIHDDFFEQGGQSLMATRVISRIRDEFQVDLPLHAIFQHSTVAKLAARIETLLHGGPSADADRDAHRSHGQARTAEVTDLSSLGALYCLNYGPNLRAYLGEDSPIVYPDFMFYPSANNPGDERWKRIRAAESIEQLATYYLAELRALRPHGPYSLVAYCGHAVVAYEVARQLQADNEQVPLMVFFDAYWPPWQSAWEWLQHFRRRLRNVTPAKIRAKARRLLGLRASNGAPTQGGAARPLSDEEVSFTRWFALLARRYRMRDGITSRCVMFWSDHSSHKVDFRSEQLRAARRWQALTTQPFESYMLPCDHTKVFERPNISIMSVLLQSCLERVAGQLAERPGDCDQTVSFSQPEPRYRPD